MPTTALIFDVDGTLADTEEAHLAAFNDAFVQHGLGWVWGRDDYRDLLEVTGGKERLRAFIDALGDTAGGMPAAERERLHAIVPALHATKTQRYTERVADGAVPLRDGVAVLLGEAVAAGLSLGIATTTTPANVDALLRATLGTGARSRFAVVAAGDMVAVKKPSPEVYELALRTLGVDADAAIAFEDSFNGVRAARAAGLWTVVTPNFWTAHQPLAAALDGGGLLRPTLAGLTLDELTRQHHSHLIRPRAHP